MSGKSRWQDDEADVESRRLEKEEKKRTKLEKQRRLEEQAETARKAAAAKLQAQDEERPSKRRRLSPGGTEDSKSIPTPLLRFTAPTWSPSRNVDNFERLNHIEEGSYGWVSRAKETATGEIVALKKLKMDKNGDGFPITALREIQTLKQARNKHVVELREVVVGETPNDIYLVMEFLEHDLKTLQEEMPEPFLLSEVKTLFLQIVSGVEFLHDNWILHRDLKTSNILLNNRGEIRLADFGMARTISDPPPPNLTQLVVTLWYRSPELLLGTSTYGPAIDIWSLGCIFGELLRNEPLLPGRSEADQLSKIFALVGVPTDTSWPGFRRLPNARGLKLPSSSNSRSTVSSIRPRFPLLTGAGVELLQDMLSLGPAARPSAANVLEHPFFSEAPRPKSTAMFPSFPSKAGGERRRKIPSPSAPERGAAPKINVDEFSGIFGASEREEVGAGFALRVTH
jgi:cell division cycle 2-like